MKSLMQMFAKPSAESLAQQELEEAQRELLRAQAGQEYASAMVQYHQRRITRLEAVVRGQKGAA